MSLGENEKAGPVTHFLLEDHRRLEGLLQSAVAQAGSVDQGAYDQFRAGLLRHIGMEEKILLPAAQRLRGGEPLSIAVKLRLDHGAIASLLMPPPTAAVIATICAVLKVHNTIEEGPGACMKHATSWPAQKRHNFWPNFRQHRNWLCCPAPMARL
jgi:hypothetical protein